MIIYSDIIWKFENKSVTLSSKNKMANIYMYDYGDNKRKAKIRNTSMLVDLSFGAAHKKQNDHRTVP